jgi:hypothetical protein
LFAFCLLSATGVSAQTPILTQHYDNGRTGQNTGETTLTPANVNSTTFGKIFTLGVDGYVYAQPLYVPGVNIAGTVHNVLYVATEHDSVWAFDADTGGTRLWTVSLIENGGTTIPYNNLNTGDIVPEIGITGTPVIDNTTNTLYVVAKTLESGNYILRLHALDITSGAEKFGGPVVMSATVSGSGSGTTAGTGTLPFSSQWENQRPGLLLLNGYVYVGFAAHGDNGPWHGWILSYKASTLAAGGAWCTSPNGIGSGLWASGSGLAADTTGNGRIFVATGNGDYPVTGNVVPTPAPAPSASVDFGDSLVQLTLSATGQITPTDYFTPYNTASLDGADTDLGSGGVIIPPTQNGNFPNVLVEAGKQGRLYIVNRDKMTLDGSHFCNGCSSDPEIIGVNNAIDGLWSMPAYWNGNMYFWANGDHLKAFTFAGSALSASQTSESAETNSFPGATPVVSANGTTNGIVWAVETDAYGSSGPAILRAYDATNVSHLLYGSNVTTNPDTLGPAVKFVVPVVTNGKVYVGAQKEVDVFGLFGSQQHAVAPAFSPAAGGYSTSVSVSISTTTPNASIYYTTNGSTPTTASTLYSGPILISSTTTLNAIATASGLLPSGTTTGVYTITTQAPAPSLTPAPGSYTAAQSVTLTDAGATIYYTTNGTTPTHNSTVYSGPISVTATTTINAIGAESGLTDSAVVSGTYTINTSGGTSINFGSGFSVPTGLQFNGSTGLDDSRLQLTNGGTNEAASAFFTTPMDIRNFTTDFSFQLSDATADGITFTIQNSSAGATALGPYGGGLGYGPDTPGGTPGIGNSIAVKFDIYNNAGEGDDSTGLYTDGASPTTPFVDLTSSGINLDQGDTIDAHITYNGTTLTMTLTDAVINKTFTNSWAINIPSTVGGNLAFIGFTGGTGGSTASQKIETWTFVSTPPQGTTVATPTITPASETFSGSINVTLSDTTSGAAIYYTTDGTTPAPGVGTTKLYGTTFAVNATETVNAIGTLSGDTNSAVAKAIYTLQAAATPTFTPGAGTITSGQTITISDLTTGAAIYYTTDGSTPAVGVGTTKQYAAPVALTASGTVKAIATASGYATSTVGSAAYTVQQAAATPAITPAAGTYATSVSVTITDTSSGALIYYTTDGSTPAVGVGTTKQYSAGFSLTASATVKAIASGGGFTASAVASNAYTVQQVAATPAITPGAGTYATSVSVTIIDSSSGALIYYTTDGTTPSPGVGTTKQYSASFALTASATVKAIASGGGFAASAVASNAYTVQQAAATPAITPGAGTYTTSVSVTITDSSSGALIYYTTDGTTPSPGVGTTKQYSASFSLTASATVKAIASGGGFATSAVASNAYTVQTTAAPPISFGSGFSATTGLQLNGSTAWNQTAGRMTLTNAANGTQAGSFFYATPVNVQAFTNNFSFQLTTPNADGFTFTIQNTAATALGPTGGGLGYGPDNTSGAPGIGKSVAVKFDLYNNGGEGVDSTGEYTNGASPTTPFADMTSSGINLHSGDVMNVQMTYDGTTLAMTVTDATAGKSFSTSWAVNIPTVVGSSTAWVGFTGATGGSTATQEIISWTYAPGQPGTVTKPPLQYETENYLSTSVSSGPTYRAFAWPGFTNGNGTTLDSTAVGQNVAITLNVPTAGTYDVKYAIKAHNTRGISQLAVNGVNLGPATDQYSANDTWVELDMGTVALTAGNNVFKFTVTGKNAASSSYTLAWDYIKLTPQ